MEEERRRRLSLVKDEEAKEAHEREVRRQHRLIAVLEAEEARARAFYDYEFQNNLRERRDMKESEQEMRLFVLESKSSTGSKYDVGGSTSKKSTKQERRDELKKAQAQKLVRERECKEMAAEDDLAMAIRTEEKKREQLAALKKVRDSALQHKLELDLVEAMASTRPRERLRGRVATESLPHRRWSSMRWRTRRPIRRSSKTCRTTRATRRRS